MCVHSCLTYLKYSIKSYLTTAVYCLMSTFTVLWAFTIHIHTEWLLEPVKLFPKSDKKVLMKLSAVQSTCVS